jgi:tRNA nucleotidyltransferase/poly(A) polymerase
MKVKISRNKRFVDAIQRNLEESPYCKYVKRVLELLDGKVVYLWGGAVRGPIVKELYNRSLKKRDFDLTVDTIRGLYGRNFKTRDFDLTVDDSKERINLRRLLRGLDGMYSSRFGTPKWRPAKGIEIDIGPFSAATILKRENLPINLETTLTSVDVTTSAIAYGLEDKTIYSVAALEDIKKKEVNVLHQYGEAPSALLCRLVLQADRLGFDIGKKGRAYIAERYSPILDGYIKEYLRYKGKQKLFRFIVMRLRHIQRLMHLQEEDRGSGTKR